MQRPITTIGAVFLVPFFVAPGWASKTHRPWLMMGAHKHRRESVRPSESIHVVPLADATTRTAPITVSASRLTPAPVATPSTNRLRLDPDQGEEVVHQALMYRGTHYRFGGVTKRGLDCSGLISRVYEDLKLKRIPRASDALYKSGKPVNLAELRPGDLVFFKNTYRRGISHVGIYTGNNKFVHASNHHTGVIVTALSDPYYQLHYAGARRLY